MSGGACASRRPIWLGLLACLFLCLRAPGQVIEFESGGLRYQTLSRDGLTIMYAQLPSQIREYTVLQVAVSNGSAQPCIIRPEDFTFYYPDGVAIRAAPARTVVENFLRKAGRDDVIKLVATYEISLYGAGRIRSTNGYEKRRQAALAEVSSTRVKAAAAASAIALVETRLNPGESTDGAVFFPAHGRPMAGGRLTVRTGGRLFEFEPELSRPEGGGSGR